MDKGRADGDRLGYLFEPLDALSDYRALCRALEGEGVFSAYGLDDAQRLHLVAGLQRALGRTVLFVTANDQLALRAYEDLSALMGGCVALLPAREVSFQRVAAASRDISFRRIEALDALLSGGLRALVAPVDALAFRLMPRDAFLQSVVTLAPGMRTEPGALAARLVASGYERVDMVEGRGQCAVRGGIVDIYPVGRTHALRVEFFDDEIDSLRDFDALSQRSIGAVNAARLLPATEAALTGAAARAAGERLQAALERALRTTGGVRGKSQRELEEKFGLTPWEEFEREMFDEDELPALDMIGKPRERPADPVTELERHFAPIIEGLRAGAHCPLADALMPILYESCEDVLDYAPGALVVLDQPDRLRERAANRALEFSEQYTAALERENALGEQGALMIPYDAVLSALTAGRAVTLSPFMRTMDDIRPAALFSFDGRGAVAYQGNLKEAARDIKSGMDAGGRTVIWAGGTARGQRLQKSLADLDCAATFMETPPDALEPGAPVILPGALSKGFSYPGIGLMVLTESDLYGVGRQKSRARWQAGEKISAFTDLKPGDYVVHEQHGVGQYMGTVRLQVDGAWGDYLNIRYQGADKLYVPTDQMDRVQKFIGGDGMPRINKLSGGEWQRQKSRVKAAIREIAIDLVKLYAQREAVPGYAYAPDTPWQREFEDSFEFEETPDQALAIEEIKRDMESPRVMDRLLCGDVGYGKTEVALRAIFKAVMDGKQAALLAPTTILVQQHFATMRKRFAHFPIRFDTISRFKTAAQQREVLGRLARGELDVIVGTHRLLNKDVTYRDLGLLVVDEEQRFGVAHKESIKALKKSVDVLTLSATPIPRTLHMSMVGIRDMSLLRTPPDERYPIQTYVLEYSDGMLRDAVLRELARGGQVYLLYNRVQSIEKFYERMTLLVPEARVAIAHGQMREQALENVMMDFFEGTYDVLLCTTIIEAGLDVAAANTLIVIDADRFGLSQLYQLRGRVGRSNRLAYAYLTVQPNKVLTETADKRLSAIREFTDFGSGFRVAMRDLEIRGTGNLLGAEQSGHMTAVGYDLYVKMIEETVRELRGDVSQGDIVTRVDVRIDAFLPTEYVSNDQLRIEAYKRIASIDGRAAREDIIEELIDRFGEPTRPVMNLIEVAHLKGLCARMGIESIGHKGGRLNMRFSPKAQVDLERLLAALARHPDVLTLVAGTPPTLAFSDARASDQSPDALIKRAVPVMEDVADEQRAEGAS